MTIVPVILCGGSGTRLWPLSRKKYPKQFSNLAGEKSLVQDTAERFQNDIFAPPYVVTNEDCRFLVQDHLHASNLPAQHIIIEPEGKNTAPAILAAALQVQKNNPDALLLVTPSDHYFKHPQVLHNAILAAQKAALEGEIITFGIKPTRPETGYGYIKISTQNVSESMDGKGGPVRIDRFVEKPDLANAKEMLKEASYFWNSGVFLFSVQTIIETFQAQNPSMFENVKAAVECAHIDSGFTRLAAEPWNKISASSIDYAIMEKAENISMQPLINAGWSDLGEWNSIWHNLPKSSDGNAIRGDAMEVKCNDSLLFNDDGNKTLVGLGLENIIAVATSDAVLVADKSNAYEVGKVVDILHERQVNQADNFNKEYRPWGWYEILAKGEGFQTKRIFLKPGGILSLQSHQHRSEHWVIVSGTARVTIGDQAHEIEKNQSTYIPIGVKHRLENPSDENLILIEVQIGSYLGEDDIERYDDVYNRPNKLK